MESLGSRIIKLEKRTNNGGAPYTVSIMLVPNEDGLHTSPEDAEVDTKLEQLNREFPGKKPSMLFWLSSERRLLTSRELEERVRTLEGKISQGGNNGHRTAS